MQSLVQTLHPRNIAGESDMYGRVVKIIFERGDATYGLCAFIAMNPARPRDVLRQRLIIVARVVVNKQASAVRVVAQERVRIIHSSDTQHLARGCKWQKCNGDSFERARMFGERAVVRDDRHIQSKRERERTRITKTPACD